MATLPPNSNTNAYVLGRVINKPKYHVPCRYHHTKKGCNYGNNCYFQHLQYLKCHILPPQFPINNQTQNIPIKLTLQIQNTKTPKTMNNNILYDIYNIKKSPSPDPKLPNIKLKPNQIVQQQYDTKEYGLINELLPKLLNEVAIMRKEFKILQNKINIVPNKNINIKSHHKQKPKSKCKKNKKQKTNKTNIINDHKLNNANKFKSLPTNTHSPFNSSPNGTNTININSQTQDTNEFIYDIYNIIPFDDNNKIKPSKEANDIIQETEVKLDIDDNNNEWSTHFKEIYDNKTMKLDENSDDSESESSLKPNYATIMNIREIKCKHNNKTGLSCTCETYVQQLQNIIFHGLSFDPWCQKQAEKMNFFENTESSSDDDLTITDELSITNDLSNTTNESDDDDELFDD